MFRFIEEARKNYTVEKKLFDKGERENGSSGKTGALSEATKIEKFLKNGGKFSKRKVRLQLEDKKGIFDKEA
jgi:hypothetical protein